MRKKGGVFPADAAVFPDGTERNRNRAKGFRELTTQRIDGAEGNCQTTEDGGGNSAHRVAIGRQSETDGKSQNEARAD